MPNFIGKISLFKNAINVFGLFFTVLALSLVFASEVQASVCPVTDGGAGDGDGSANGVITINANATWTPSDATAWDCSGLDLLITNNSTLTFGSNTASGYYGYLQIDNLQIDNGSAISSNAKGCPGYPGGNGGGPNTSTNVCGQGVSGYGRISGGASGAGYGGAGGAGSTQPTVGTTYGSSSAPVLFGSSGGGENYFGPQTTGGTGGGVVRLSISENFLFNGSISANGGNGTTGSYGFAAGGGSGGSIYVVVTGVITGSTGTLSANGGAGGNNTSDGGGGGGGRVSITGVDLTSFLSGLTASAVAAGGSGPDTAADGSTGSLYAFLYTPPSTPSLSSPLSASYNNSLNLTLTSSNYSSNGVAHSSSDWMVKTDNNCTTTDNRVWYKNDDSANKTSIVVNTSNGAFTGALSGQTTLASNTQYYACVRHTNIAGDSAWSTARLFTTVASGLTTHSWLFDAASEYATYNNSQYVEVNASGNGLAQLVDLGGGKYAGYLLQGWSKRKPITVTNNVASELTNYQVKITVAYDADMQTDFDDIRFTSSDGTTFIDHWLETKTDSSTATFWVEVPTIPASSTATVYVYYGNSGASSASNGINTFTKFDDFSNGSTLSGIWSTKNTDANRTISQGSGSLTISANTSANSDWWSGTDLAPNAYTAAPSDDWSAQVTITAYTDNSSTQGGMAAVQSWTNASQAYLWGRFNSGTSGRIVLEKLGTQGLATVANGTLPLQIRIRKIGTTKYYDYSVDGGVNWTSAYNNTEMTVASISLFQKEWAGNAASTTFDNFLIRKVVSTEPSTSTGAEETTVDYDTVKLYPAVAGGEHPEYVQLGTFSVTLGAGNQGNISYQISNNGTNWYYFNTGSGTWTAVSADDTDNNTESQVNAYLPKFTTDVGTGELYFKAFLISDGAQRVELDSISLNYVPPVELTTLTITDNSGYTNDSTPVMTLVSSGATPSHVAFSCDGTNWSSWLTYPDDNVVNDEDGPAFNMTTDATNCSTTNELKTIRAKIKDANSESPLVTDTTTYDTVSPTVLNVSATNASATYGAGEILTVTVQFSDTTMTVTGTPRIELDMDGSDRQSDYASTSTDTLSFTYTVVNGDNKTDLDYTGTGALTLNGGTITDRAGNTATLTLASPGAAGSLGANKNINIVTNQNPTVATVTGVQSINGDGDVTVRFIMDDSDDDNTLQAKIEYSLNGGSTWNDPTLSTVNSETTASFGDPSIDNSALYQVGQSGAYITSSSGANTITVVWEASADVLSSTDISTAKIRITPYDGQATGTAVSSGNFILDLVSPSGLANGDQSIESSSKFKIAWTPVTESNFSHYEIWYGYNAAQVAARTGAVTEWDDSDDSALLNQATNFSVVISSSNLSGNFFQVFAVDDYGNTTTVGGNYISLSDSGTSDTSSSSSSSSSGSTVSGGGSSEDSVTSDEDESNEVSDEEATEVEPNEEPDDETTGSIWDEWALPDHWSNGYVKHLQEQNNIVEVVVVIPTFTDILEGIFYNSDSGISRGESLEFLLALAGYQLDDLSINIRELAFSDVDEDNKRVGFIQFAYEQRLITGYPDGTFQPNRVVNRAEALKLVAYFFDIEVASELYGDELLAAYGLKESPFTDIDLNAWYAPYIIHAHAYGVVNGYGDGRFGPDNGVTYAEFLKIATLFSNIENAVELAEELE